MKSANKKESTISVKIKNHNDSKGGHPHIILDDIGNKHVSIGITHTKKNKKKPNNHELKINPLGETRKSYMQRSATVKPKREYFRTRNGLMNPEDFNKAKLIGDKKKKNYLENKKK